jgi:integrase
MASIEKRPDGKYRARWREYPGGPQGAKHFARKIDAERFLIDVQHRLLSGTYTAPSAGQVTVAAYAADWQTRRSWAPATHDRIERELRLYILPKLGPRPLASLRRAHIEEWAKNLPVAPSSARKVYETLSALLSAAVDDGCIARNPATGAHLTKVDSAPLVPLTSVQIATIASRTARHIRAGVIVAAATGLRQGELFGLTVDRIDFLRRELRVDQQLWTPSRGTPFLKPPKSANSYRTIALSQRTVETLSEQVRRFGEGEERIVFHIDSRPVSRSMASKYMRLATKAAKLDGTTWHDLRHYHASMLLSEGVSPALVAERLGDDIKTLLETYAHVIRADDDRVRSIVDATLGDSAEDLLRTDSG